MEIKQLRAYSRAEMQLVGEFGYISDQKFEVSKEETLNKVTINISLKHLDTPYKKKEMNEEDDHERYSKLVSLGYSLALYVGNEPAAIAITEPQDWNNTLLIWHFQVAEHHKRKSYGKKLMSKLEEVARENGCRAITLETQNTNAPAIRFYQSCGFEIEGVDLSFYTNHDVEAGEVALFMKKKLL
ncbi:GNAT family N-acetyltransferase [Paenibacillus apiarius]|uniref:GNAT family N-acetyltransferase n=1 Tax=Paenibacillus apiarius TaxID=46240 RepID=UPI00197DC5F5|nr:GNAT family N-acetyltransferase [Paenibacillus apiarius]MBN3526844.1 GNAT family N-acetyltransferase [Paenibacillus apiarius]